MPESQFAGDLSGKSVLITGAGRGIGAAAAVAFARAGAQVGLAGRDPDRLQPLADRIGAMVLRCDVAEFAQVEAAVDAMVAAHGRLDVLINNAGLIEPIATLAEADPDAWGRLVATNLTGVFHGFRAALPGMLAQGSGTILTIGSGAAYNPLEGWSAYCASKAGALMLTRAAHLEVGGNVRVMSLSPGTVATDMQATIRDSGINPVSRLDWSAHIPPEWPARALLWMCTPEADSWLGGEVSLRDPAVRARLGLGG